MANQRPEKCGGGGQYSYDNYKPEMGNPVRQPASRFLKNRLLKRFTMDWGQSLGGRGTGKGGQGTVNGRGGGRGELHFLLVRAEGLGRNGMLTER